MTEWIKKEDLKAWVGKNKDTINDGYGDRDTVDIVPLFEYINSSSVDGELIKGSEK